jgi:hypothetical protein
MSQYDFPTQVISLPSEGRCYPNDNPLSSGQLEIKYMTAREEEILSSQNLIKKGVVLDKLFESIIVDSSVNPDDIILGDKNAIMLATRILGYGPEYQIEMEDEYGDKKKIEVDLGQVQTKDVNLDVLNEENTYKFTTPVGKNELEFKLLSHGDEKAIDADVKAMRKFNKGGVSTELTTRYRYIIKSVDGKDDTKSIVEFINNKFLARDTRAFRDYISSISPDVNMEFEYENAETGEMEARPIPMGVGFFWPST